MKQFNKAWLFLLAIPLSIGAQELKGDSPIPFDKDVRMGKLKNGLTYYIRKNTKPENKVDLRLVVNAGAILEDDDQRGLAHFMEHMNFNGTKHFPKNMLVDYLQSIGVKFGQHLNAQTGFDETVYFLPIPSDDKEKLEKGFQIIEDWAFNANLTPEEIDKERGVVLEEYRIGLGADRRMLDKYLPVMMYQSHYAERLPIGKKEILEHFTYDKIIRFHKDWYRPDLMCVIVVGDINVDEMEAKVKAHFGSYQNPAAERPRKDFEVPNHKETLVAIESDKEASRTQIQLMYKDEGPAKRTITINDYKQDLAENLFSSMLNTRLEELRNAPNPPFTYGFSYHGGTLARNKEAYQSVAMVPEDKVLEAIKVLVTENARAKKYGFTQSELDRAKSDVLAQYEQAYNERDKSESSDFVWQYQANFLEASPAPGIEWEFNAVKKLLPQIGLEQVNGVIKDFVKDNNRVVVITGPEKEGLKKVTEAEVLDALKIDENTITPYKDVQVATGLLRNPVKPGSIVKKEKDDKIGSTTLFLSNGAKVTYKKTDFKNEEIIMEGVSLGGTSLYSDQDLKKTVFANGGLSQAGFSGLKLNDINKFMSGKIANANPYITNFSEGIRGSSTPKDLEYLFQMTYAYFTDLNLDQDAFASYRQKTENSFKNMASDPNFFFQQEFLSYLWKDSPRFNGFPTEASWKVTDYQLAYNKYKERFANAADFEFYFVGNVDDKTMEDFASKYIAALPANGQKEKAVDSGYRMQKGDLKKIVNKGSEAKSAVRILYYGDAAYTPKEAFTLQALGEVLTIKLIEELRENESGVYGISANGNMNKVPYGAYNFTISFPCGPENAEKLTASALKELQKIIDNGPEEKDMVKFREAELLDYKKDLKDNQFWLGNFVRSYVNGMSPDEVMQMNEKINAVTAKDIQDTAKKYLTKDKVIGILMPEKS